MSDHISPPIIRIVTPEGRFTFHGVIEVPDLATVNAGVAICGYCGTSPSSAVARACTSVRCPLVKSDFHHIGRDAA